MAGWGGYTIAAMLGSLAWEAKENFFAVLLVRSAIAIAATVLMRNIYRRLWTRSPWVLGGGVLLTCYAVAAVWRVAINIVYWDWVKHGYRPETWFGYIDSIMGYFYVMLCWSGLYFGIKYYQQFQQQTEQTLKATALAHEAQLKMLRYQLNPHFLFNTLNAISTLILDGANTTANQAVSRLSDFLRYTLDNDPMKRVTLGSELGATDLYLEIEKVRFGDRLIIEKEIQPEAMDALVPSLILQPMIENSIKYAITPSEEGGTIRISARLQSEMLVLQIADTGPGLGNGKTTVKSSGVGLKNTKERLSQFLWQSPGIYTSAKRAIGPGRYD